MVWRFGFAFANTNPVAGAHSECGDLQFIPNSIVVGTTGGWSGVVLEHRMMGSMFNLNGFILKQMSGYRDADARFCHPGSEISWSLT